MNILTIKDTKWWRGLMDVRSNARREIKKKRLIYLNDPTLVEISRKSPLLRDINPVLFIFCIPRFYHQLITLASCAENKLLNLHCCYFNWPPNNRSSILSLFYILLYVKWRPIMARNINNNYYYKWYKMLWRRYGFQLASAMLLLSLSLRAIIATTVIIRTYGNYVTG